MTTEELENWRTQIASSNSEKMGLRYPPFCETSYGTGHSNVLLTGPVY